MTGTTGRIGEAMIRGLPKIFRLGQSAAALIVAASLAGCTSISEKMSHAGGTLPGVGLPANAPERPTEKLAFPAVHDMPPQRTTAVLTAEEQRMVERDLVSVRDNQRGRPPPEAARKPAARPAVTAPALAPPEPDPAPRRAPTSSSQSIY